MTGAERRYVVEKTLELTMTAVAASEGMPKAMATRPEDINKLLQATCEKLVELYGVG